MKNHGILDWHNWSAVRRAQFLTTALFAFITIGFVVDDAIGVMIWQIEQRPVGPPSTFSSILAGIFLVLLLPAAKLAHGLGIGRSLGYWGWRLLAIAVNTVMGFCLGSLIGWLVIAKFTHVKNDE